MFSMIMKMLCEFIFKLVFKYHESGTTFNFTVEIVFQQFSLLFCKAVVNTLPGSAECVDCLA